MRAGMGQRAALITIIALQTLFIVINVSLCSRLNINIILLIDIALWLLFNVVLNRRIRKKGAQTFSI